MIRLLGASVLALTLLIGCSGGAKDSNPKLPADAKTDPKLTKPVGRGGPGGTGENKGGGATNTEAISKP